MSWDTVVVVMTRAPPCSSGDWGRGLSPTRPPCVQWLSGIGSQFAGEASEGGVPHCPTSHSSGTSGGAHAHEPTPVSHTRFHAGRVPLSSCSAGFVLLPSSLLVLTELLPLHCFRLLLRSVEFFLACSCLRACRCVLLKNCMTAFPFSHFLVGYFCVAQSCLDRMNCTGRRKVCRHKHLLSALF